MSEDKGLGDFKVVCDISPEGNEPSIALSEAEGSYFYTDIIWNKEIISQTHVKLQEDLKSQEDLIDKVDAYLAHVLEEFQEQQNNHIELIKSMSEHINQLEARVNELANSKTASTPNKSSRTHNRFQR